MGASWAPFLAQMTTWGIVSFTVSGDEDLGLVLPKEGVPSILPLILDGVEAGYIFVCIDNVAIIVRDQGLQKKWRTRLERNARILRVTWKEMTQGSQADFRFLGIDYCNGLWRHEGDRVERWVLATLRPLPTVKQVQRIIGILVWDFRVRCKPLFDLGSAFSILRKRLKTRVSYDEVVHLNAFLEVVIKNVWETQDLRKWPFA
jgi:hypothetical protein